MHNVTCILLLTQFFANEKDSYQWNNVGIRSEILSLARKVRPSGPRSARVIRLRRDTTRRVFPFSLGGWPSPLLTASVVPRKQSPGSELAQRRGRPPPWRHTRLTSSRYVTLCSSTRRRMQEAYHFSLFLSLCLSSSIFLLWLILRFTYLCHLRWL